MSYGCYNRPPLKDSIWFQVGYQVDEQAGTRTAAIAPFINPMTKTCQYQKNDKYADPGCVGCVHKQSLSGNTLDLFDGTHSANTKQST
jgi:hypothetical protein